MSALLKWAESELDRLVKDNDEMQREINKDILDVVKVFSEQGHSGFSASYAINLLNRLLSWKPVTPLTGEESEWGEVRPWNEGNNLQQNLRCSAVFRNNFDNSTAYYIDGKVFSDDGGRTWFTKGGKGSSVSVTFPYAVPDKPEYIIINEGEVKSNEA